MGARIHFIIKADNSGNNIVLYSHWGQTTWEQDLQEAIAAAKPRWSQTDYSTRIIVSQLIGDQWGKEVNYGLYVGTENTTYWDDTVTIDLLAETVEWSDNCVGFEAFCKGDYEVDDEDEDDGADEDEQ